MFRSQLSGVQVDDVVDESVRCEVDGIQHHLIGFEFGCPNHLIEIINNKKQKGRTKEQEKESETKRDRVCGERGR